MAKRDRVQGQRVTACSASGDPGLLSSQVVVARALMQSTAASDVEVMFRGIEPASACLLCGETRGLARGVGAFPCLGVA